MSQHETPVAFIGGGNMARAILEGARRAGALGERWVVAEPDEGRRGDFAHGVASAGEALDRLEAMEASPGEGQLVLAVKPQVLGAVAEEIGARVASGPSRVVVSILAGMPSGRIRGLLGEPARVVRVMPNLALQIGRGMSAVCLGEGGREGDEARATELLEGAGRVVTIRESLMDAFTGIAGSGPAYVFYLAEGMMEAAVELGFTREEALLIVRETIAGAGELMASVPEHPHELRASVTSRGGTTAAATRVFDESGLMDIVGRAVKAARHRGAELGAG